MIKVVFGIAVAIVFLKNVFRLKMHQNNVNLFFKIYF